MTRSIFSAPREYEHWPVEYVEDEELVEEKRAPAGADSDNEDWTRSS